MNTKIKETIDLTPTWTSITPLIITGIQRGGAEAQEAMREELMKMAGLADAYVRQQAPEEEEVEKRLAE